MKTDIIKDSDYIDWVKEVKAKIQNTQIKTAVHVNTALLSLYWELGEMLVKKQSASKWGDGIIDQLSKDLLSEFPGISGFSRTNLLYIKKWFLFYSQSLKKVPQLVGQIEKIPQLVGQIDSSPKIEQLVSLIPWGHNREIITKCKDEKEAIFYVLETIKNNWSRNILIRQIESSLYVRQGKAINNFELTLPALQSDLAKETLKNPYNFDFLSLGQEIQERELETALINHIKKFIRELGRGFAYVGNQQNLNVGGDDFFLDLLFYNYHLHCFVIFELKIDEFKPEYAGKLNFYINTVNEQIKAKEDAPTIGVLLCKTPNETVVKYALQGIKTPMGVSEYELAKALPKQLKGEMPSIKELEAELNNEYKTLQKPIDQKLDKLKGLLSELKTEQVKEKQNPENTVKVFNKVLVPLKKGISLSLEKDIVEWFESIEITIWIGGHGHNTQLKARDYLSTVKHRCGEFSLSVRTKGFKPAGIEAFDCVKELYISLSEYKYSIGMNRHGQQAMLEELYHKLPAQVELNNIIEKFCEVLIDDITNQVERIKNKK